MARYFQCELAQGDARTVGWIEERGARAGASVELTELGGFWTVLRVFPQPFEETALRKKQANDRHALPSLVGV